MGKIINLNNKKSSLLSTIFHGTPSELKLFGETIKFVDKIYIMKKQKEFFNSYWEYFVEGLCDIKTSQEFDSSYTIRKFNSLSEYDQNKVLWDCSEIYIFENKLTYANFIKVVNHYISDEDYEDNFIDPENVA